MVIYVELNGQLEFQPWYPRLVIVKLNIQIVFQPYTFSSLITQPFSKNVGSFLWHTLSDKRDPKAYKLVQLSLVVTRFINYVAKVNRKCWRKHVKHFYHMWFSSNCLVKMTSELLSKREENFPHHQLLHYVRLSHCWYCVFVCSARKIQNLLQNCSTIFLTGLEVNPFPKWILGKYRWISTYLSLWKDWPVLSTTHTLIAQGMLNSLHILLAHVFIFPPVYREPRLGFSTSLRLHNHHDVRISYFCQITWHLYE